jgi:hypothetical protein
MYIILGEPNEMQRFDGKQGPYPCQLWFYQGKDDLSLPNGFYLMFWQERGIGDYKLYSPVKDGPQALLTAHIGDPTDYLAAYEKILDIEPILAERSMSLIEGESSSGLGRPSLTSDMLLQKIENSSTSGEIPRKHAIWPATRDARSCWPRWARAVTAGSGSFSMPEKDSNDRE